MASCDWSVNEQPAFCLLTRERFVSSNRAVLTEDTETRTHDKVQTSPGHFESFAKYKWLKIIQALSRT
jgi:hypothetical protein